MTKRRDDDMLDEPVIEPEYLEISIGGPPGDTLDESRILVYINGFACLFYDSPQIKKYLEENIDVKNFTVFSRLKNVPVVDIDAIMGVSRDPESFFQGIALSEYEHVRKNGGVYINAMACGIINNPIVWKSVLNNSSMKQKILYIDIPYDIYKEVAEDKAVSEEEYKKQNTIMSEIINDIKDSVGSTVH